MSMYARTCPGGSAADFVHDQRKGDSALMSVMCLLILPGKTARENKTSYKSTTTVDKGRTETCPISLYGQTSNTGWRQLQ